MSKINFISLAIMVTVLSCGQNQQDFQKLNASQDSTALALQKQLRQEKIKKDSLIKVEEDKAIGDIRFHISEKKFKAEKEIFINKFKLPEMEYYKRAAFIRNKIGGYGFNDVYGLFYNDSLYSIQLTGCIISYDDYDRAMPEQFTALIDLLKEKYGDPITKNGLPSWTEIQKGYFFRCAVWQIGDKKIEVRISCDGIKYTLDLAIFKPSIEKLIEQNRLNKANEDKEKGAKAL